MVVVVAAVEVEVEETGRPPGAEEAVTAALTAWLTGLLVLCPPLSVVVRLVTTSSSMV